MNYTVYQITNTVNGKIYVGVHQTNNIDDSYFGSSLVLNAAIEKYGIENFEKTILEIYDNPDDMFAKEKEIVSEDFVKRADTYNIRVGGIGSFDYINNEVLTPELRKLGGVNGANSLKKKRLNEQWNKKWRKKMEESGCWSGDTWRGRKHTDETKKKIGEKNSVIQSGSGNSQYGTMWITNDRESKKINKNDAIPNGWRKGRKIKV